MKKNVLITTLLILFALNNIRANAPKVFLEAHVNEDEVVLSWSAELYAKGGYFIIEKSMNAKNWIHLVTINFAGPQHQLVKYIEMDNSPIIGNSYYRLKRVAYNGDISYSNVVPVKYKKDAQIGSLIPFSKDKIKSNEVGIKKLSGKIFFVVLRDNDANEYFCKAYITELAGELYAEPVEAVLPEGTFLVVASDNDVFYSQRMTIKK